MISESYRKIKENINSRFSHLIIRDYFVLSTSGRIQKFRVELINKAIVDIYYSSSGKYSFHYETETDIFRMDNAPHHPELHTFPGHIHFNESIIECKNFENIDEAITNFFELVYDKFLSQLN